MILSASDRTDIPAFYGEWFMARLDAGNCRVINPYSGSDGGPAAGIDLAADAIDGIVFWTKNIGPFRRHLDEIRRRGFAFTVQYSINNYPRVLENSVTDADRAVDHMHDLARRFGRRVAVWRYDPVIATSATPFTWHKKNFARLAARLAGATDEVVVSFAHIYRKTRRNLDTAAHRHDFTWRDPPAAEKRDLAAALARIAADHGMRLAICAQPDLVTAGAAPARCIDAARLSEIAGRDIAAPTKGNRPGCLCHRSRDIGAYDSCPHGCVYCYAVTNQERAHRRYRAQTTTAAALGAQTTDAKG